MMKSKWEFYYRIAASSYGKQQMPEQDTEKEQNNQENPFAAPSWKQIQFELKKKRKSMMHAQLLKFSKVAAVVFVVLGMTGAFLVVNIEGLTNQLYNFLFEKQESYTRIVPEVKVDWDDVDNSALKGYYSPTLFPEGYHLTSIMGKGKNVDIVFSDGEPDTTITFTQCEPGNSITFDTENMDVHEVTINGQSGFWGEKHDYRLVVWGNTHLIFSLLVPEKYDNFIEIAESVEYYP